MIERFSFECRKIIGFDATRLALKKLTPRFHPIRYAEVKLKVIVTRLHLFSRALLQLHAITSSFDRLTGFSPSSVIGQNEYFGFVFITLN